MTDIASPEPGSPGRPIGHVWSFLEDVKARGLIPRGILDVGAHKGNWTRAALRIFPGTPVTLIEPLDEMEERLSELVREVPGCHYIKAGAGRTDGERELTVSRDLYGSSYLTNPTEGVDVGTEEPIRRKTLVKTIDGILRDSFPAFEPDLIKLDTQGYELEVLSGADSVFGRTELFIVETSLYQFMPGMPSTREVIAFMADRGYELYDVTEYLRRPLDGALGQIDLAFAMRDGKLRRSHEWVR